MFKSVYAKKATPVLTLGAMALWQYQQKQQQQQAQAEARFSVPYFTVGLKNNPMFEKRWKGGEDAFVVSSNQRLLGVADGVGGWAKKEVCSGKFSRFLLGKVGQFFEADETRCLKEILVDAFKVNPHGGSTTVVLAKLDKDASDPAKSAVLRTCFLGDSTYMIVRPESDLSLKKVHRSEEQQHRFNCPYQCGGNFDLKDLQKQAAEFEHQVEHNDVVVLGTDGVFDNLFDEQIISHCLQPHMRQGGALPKPEDAALCIASLAESLSYTNQDESPWTVNAVAAGKKRKKNLGGKQDDITVIVGQVKLRH